MQLQKPAVFLEQKVLGIGTGQWAWSLERGEAEEAGRGQMKQSFMEQGQSII